MPAAGPGTGDGTTGPLTRRPIHGFLFGLGAGSALGLLFGALAAGAIGWFYTIVQNQDLGTEADSVIYLGAILGGLLGLPVGMVVGPGLFWYALRRTTFRRLATIGALFCALLGALAGLAAMALLVLVVGDGEWSPAWFLVAMTIAALAGGGAGWLLGTGLERAYYFRRS